MATKRLQAKCLCGGVRIDADYESVHVAACHCEICRRWAGGPFMALENARNVVLAGTDLISIYASSEWGERGFCKRCGSALFFRTKDEAMYAISAMAVGELVDAEFTDEIFIDSKPGWYAFANETRTATGAEVFAKFAQGQDKPHG